MAPICLVIVLRFFFFFDKKRNKKLKGKIMLRIFSVPTHNNQFFQVIKFLLAFSFSLLVAHYFNIHVLFEMALFVNTAGAAFRLAVIIALDSLN
jgi:hypothetical protein